VRTIDMSAARMVASRHVSFSNAPPAVTLRNCGVPSGGTRANMALKTPPEEVKPS
jgi:hypothetical protein